MVELETDKVTIEVPSPVAGVLEAIAANPGDTVNVGALIGAIGEGAAAARPADAPKPADVPKPAAAPAPAPAFTPEPAPPSANGSVVAPPSPSAQKLIAEKGLEATAIAGSGKRGQVLKQDVLAAAAPAPAAAHCRHRQRARCRPAAARGTLPSCPARRARRPRPPTRRARSA